MRPLPLCVAALCLLALLLIITAPATLLDAGLNQFTTGKARLVVAEGTLWSGKGQLEIRNAGGAAVANRAVTWQFDYQQLLLARLTFSFNFYPQTRASTLTASFSTLEFADLALSLPASAVALLLPAVQGYEVQGRLSLHSDKLSFSRTGTEGRILLQWQDVSSTLVPVSPLGSYELQLDGGPAPAQFSVELRTLQGPLHLDGAGSLGMNQPVDFSGTASVSDEQYETIAPFLRLIAVEVAGGRFLLQH